MNLKRKHWKKIIPIALGVIVGGLLLAFFIRVATWEASYYAEKEGSERAEPEIIHTDALDETPISEEEVEVYIVPEDQPRYLIIGKLDIKARVIPVSTLPSGEVGTPNNIFDVGWYNGSSRPGFGGKILIDGHSGGPRVNGVFKRLPDLDKGDIITIERGDGRTYDYRITENYAVDISDANGEMRKVFKTTEKETLVLITCTGTWDSENETYDARQFVYAELVEE